MDQKLLDNKSKTKHFTLNVIAFVIAFLFGLFYVTYMDAPKERSVIKYPTPYNVNKTVYKGLNDECYKFKATEVKCTPHSILQPII